MKLLTLLILGALLAPGLTAAEVKGKFWEQPPRSYVVGKDAVIKLAAGGKALCEVVVDTAAAPAAKAAAKNLAESLTKVIGSTVAVVNAPTNQGKVALIVGDGELTRSLGVDVTPLVRDGFIIRSFGKDKIVIAGRDDKRIVPGSKRVPFSDVWERATMFGVTTFLKKFAGVEYFFPGEIGTVVKKNPNLALPELNVFDRPDALVRFVYSYGKLDGKMLDGFTVRPRNHTLRFQTQLIPCGHALARLHFPERFGKTHPEYFAMAPDGKRMIYGRNSQLCWSSGIVEEIYQDARAWLSGESPTYIRGTNLRWNPHVQKGFFDVMPNDGMAICACEKCKAFRDNGGKYNALLWKYTIDWANRLKKEGIKGYITQMSYGNHEIPNGVKVPDNVLVMTALRGPWYYAPGSDLKEEKAHIADLVTRTNGKVWYWCYTLKRGARMIEGVPHSTPRMLGELYKTLMPYTFGIFLENSTDQYMFMFLHDYMTAEMFWDFSIDPDQLLDKAYASMFGKKAAVYMDKFFRIQEDIWANKILSNRRMGPLGPEFDIADSNKLWSEIYSDECIAKLENLLKSAEKAAAKEPENLARIKYIRKSFFDTVLDARNRFRNEQMSVKNFNVSIPAVTAPLTIDGKLNEPAWKKAAVLKLKALKGDAIEVKTTLKLLRDKDYLYCAVAAEEPAMQNVRKDYTTDFHNMLWADEVMEFFFAAPNRKDYRQLIINSLGKKAGYNATMIGSKYKILGEWRTTATVAASASQKSYTIEFKMPWSELYCDKDGSIIANVVRSRHHNPVNPKVTYYSWSPFAKRLTDLDGFGKWIPGKVESDNILGSDGNFAAPQTGRAFGKWITTPKAAKAGDVALDDKVFLFDGQSMCLKNSVPGSAVSVNCYLQLKPATRYRLSWWVKTENMSKERKGSIFPQIWNGAQNVAIPGKAVTANIPWTRLSGEFVTAPAVPGKKPVYYIALYNYKSTGTAWIDGVELTEVASEK